MNHRHSWEMIPWLVNSSLPEAGRVDLMRHIGQCAACRREVEVQRSLMNAMRTLPPVENMPHGSLQKLWSRIDADPSADVSTPSASRVPAPQRVVGWLVAAVVLQALLLGTMSLYLLDGSRRGGLDAAYRTVSSAAPAAGVGSVRAVFSPTMTLGELQALLERSRLQIVNGPSPDGVYTLATVAAGDDPRQAILALRAHPGVKFAESVAP